MKFTDLTSLKKALKQANPLVTVKGSGWTSGTGPQHRVSRFTTLFTRTPDLSVGFRTTLNPKSVITP